MAYKTVLVHLNDERRAGRVINAGIEIARAFDAHLIGLYVMPLARMVSPLPTAFTADVIGRIKTALKEDVEKIKKIFDEMTANQPFVAEWRSITTEQRDTSSIVLEHARAADLTIASQADPSWSMTYLLDVADELTLGSGGPVLVVPNAGAPWQRMPRTITVGWNGRRESARAIHDALPLLKLAEKVYVLTVPEDEAREGALPDTEIGAALARHGVNVQISKEPASQFTVGEELLVRSTRLQSDMLVMGCYGHSRLREFALGGVTRHILRDATISVLFSH
ncbi:MAG: universal stress protein [Hyphomicrobiales bacterium]